MTFIKDRETKEEEREQKEQERLERIERRDQEKAAKENEAKERQLQLQIELEILRNKPRASGDVPTHVGSRPKLPKFDEQADDMDAFLAFSQKAKIGKKLNGR